MGCIPLRVVPSAKDERSRARETAAEIHNRLQALLVKNTPNERRVQRAFSRVLKRKDGRFVLEVAREVRRRDGYHSVPYELILAHAAAFSLLGEKELEDLGQGLDSWWSVHSFARTLSGPAWRDGLINDEVILKWAER